MIAWPDFSRDAATATLIDWPRVVARLPVAPPPEAAVTETPLAGREPHPPAEAALEEKPSAAPPRPARRRRWPMLAALMLSLAAHAALAFWLAERMSRPGVEAETDAISVEIVLEEAEPATAASIAGAAQSSEGSEEGRPAALPLDESPRDPAPPPLAPPLKGETNAVAAISPGVIRDIGADAAAKSPSPLRGGARGGGNSECNCLAGERARPPSQQVEPVMPSEPLPPTLSVLDPFRPELASPPVVPPPSPLDDIPLELVPVPMPRPERPPVAERVRPSQPRRAEAANRAGPTAAENSAATREPAAEPGGKDQAGRKRAERRERGGETAAPAKAQAAGSAARSASSAGAVASYARKVNGHLQRHKRYPAEAARQNLKGAVRLAVTIDRGGRLLGVRVSAGSGHAALDRAALATAKRASPYPSPPQGVGGRSLTLAFSLRYGR